MQELEDGQLHLPGLEKGLAEAFESLLGPGAGPSLAAKVDSGDAPVARKGAEKTSGPGARSSS